MVFERACKNILETYFPILMDDEILSLQSEEYFFVILQINRRKIVIFKLGS
jgi:hypothetical protein